MGRTIQSLRELIGHRKTRYGLNTVAALFLFLAIVVVVKALAIRHNMRIDLTEGRRHTLSDQSIKLVQSLKEDVSAVAFYQTDQPGRAAAQDLLDQYAHFSGNFRYEFVDPDRRPGLARRYGITTYGTVVLESGGKEQKVQVAEEQNLTNALVKLLREEKRVIYFLTGHGEADLESAEREGLSQVKQDLTDLDYEVKPLLLLREQEVPRDADVVIIAGPQTNLLPAELEALGAYVTRGGKLLVLVDPFTQPGLTDLLKKYGLRLGHNVIVDRLSRIFGGDYLMPVVTQYESHPITRDFNVASFFPFAQTVDAVDTPGVSVRPLGRTGSDSWAETDKAALDRGEASFDPETDRRGPVPVGAVATIEPQSAVQSPTSDVGTEPKTVNDELSTGRSKQGAIVAYGTSAFIRNMYVNLSGNRDLFLNSLSWLAEEEELIAIRPREARFTPLVLTASQARVAFWGTVIIPPLAVIGIGMAVALRRRRAS